MLGEGVLARQHTIVSGIMWSLQDVVFVAVGSSVNGVTAPVVVDVQGWRYIINPTLIVRP